MVKKKYFGLIDKYLPGHLQQLGNTTVSRNNFCPGNIIFECLGVCAAKKEKSVNSNSIINPYGIVWGAILERSPHGTESIIGLITNKHYW